MTPEEMEGLARRMGRPLSDAVVSYVAPIYWTDPRTEPVSVLDSASIFFINTGERTFAVTTSHVYHAYLRKKEATPQIICVVSSRIFVPEASLIDDNPDLDVATFAVNDGEIRRYGKVVLTGSQRQWPPAPPQAGRRVFFAGFPGKARRVLGPTEVEFGIYAANTVATEVTNELITCEFDCKRWIDHIGLGLPEQNYDLSGLSGAPLLTLVEQEGVLSWRLGGVIYSGPRTMSDMILARRPDFIRSDGSLRGFAV